MRTPVNGRPERGGVFLDQPQRVRNFECCGWWCLRTATSIQPRSLWVAENPSRWEMIEWR